MNNTAQLATLPNLAGIATSELVEHIGAGSFKAAYINWSRTMNLLRQHAPGWMPELVPSVAGNILHEAPAGGYLLIRFRNLSGEVTSEVPQAVMDHKNAAIVFSKITARDISDTHRRGVCLAAAFTFGLAYELWAKLPMESGFHGDSDQSTHEAAPLPAGRPTDGAWEAMDADEQAFLQKIANETTSILASGDAAAAHDYIASQRLVAEEKIALWTRLDSKARAALKKADAESKSSTNKEAA